MNYEKTLYPQKELKGFPDIYPTFSKGLSHFLAVSSGPQFTSLLCSHWSPPPRTCAHPPVVPPSPALLPPPRPQAFPPTASSSFVSPQPSSGTGCYFTETFVLSPSITPCSLGSCCINRSFSAGFTPSMFFFLLPLNL